MSFMLDLFVCQELVVVQKTPKTLVVGCKIKTNAYLAFF